MSWDGDRVLVAVPDGPGVLSKTAGVLALHSLDVLSAAVATHAGMAVNTFTVAPRFGTEPGRRLLRQDLAGSLDGSLPLAGAAQAKERSYERARRAGSRRRACSGSTARRPTPASSSCGPATPSACCTG